MSDAPSKGRSTEGETPMAQSIVSKAAEPTISTQSAQKAEEHEHALNRSDITRVLFVAFVAEAVERAERSRAPIQGIADRLAGYLVYFALAAAAITFLITHNMRSTIFVVIVAGACGIAAGTPLAIFGAIGRVAQDGAIIKGGLYLGSLAKVARPISDRDN